MDERGVTITNHGGGGEWKVILAGGGMVAIGVGVALLAAQLGTAAIIVAVGGSVGLAAAGIGKGLEFWCRGQGQKHLGQAMIMAARRGQLPEAADRARLLSDPHRERWS